MDSSDGSGGGGSGGSGGSDMGGASTSGGGVEVDDSLTNLIVNYLPQSMTDSELFSIFVTCGSLVQAKIIRDRKTGYSFGYGFVNFENAEDAEKAIGSINGLPVQNKILKVSYARPNTELIKDTNLYISNIGPNVTEETIHNIFGTYGKIITCNILKDPLTKKCKGVAFVRYSKQVEAKDAIAALNGTMMTGFDKPIMVKIAEEHGKNNARFYCNPANQWQNHPQNMQQFQQQQQHFYAGNHRGYPPQQRGGYNKGGRGRGGRGGGGGGGAGNNGNRYNPMNQGRGGFY